MKSPWSWIPSLYFAEGLPYVAVMTISLILYKQLGLSNADITFYTSWLYLPWVIKPLWSPFIDIIKTKRWWITTMQLLIGAAFGGIAFTIPSDFWLQGTLCFFWLMAFASATHDIAADGFYMLGLDQHDQAWFVGIRSTFYRIASVFGQGVIVVVAGLLENRYGDIPRAWSTTLLASSALFLAITLWHQFILPSENGVRVEAPVSRETSSRRTVLSAFATFFRKPGVWLAIIFMLLYRLPEALSVKMLTPFLLDAVEDGGLGLSTAQSGLVYGTVGVIALTLGGILGGVWSAKVGLRKALWPMALALALPCSVYLYMALAQPQNILTIYFCVALDQFGYGFGFTAYMLYMMYFSRGEYSTSHYAVCTAFMALSMMVPGFFAGMLQESLGYSGFFVLVMVCCLATVAVTALLPSKIEPGYGRK